MSVTQQVKQFSSLVKFSHTIFAMPFALIGFFIAVLKDGYSFQISKLVFVILCMISARNAAMAFNRWLDEKYDALNPRTAVREIPSGIITKKNAFVFIIINCLLFCFFAYQLQTICLILAPVALFVILFYSYTKRFTSLCHIVLGIGLSLAPIGAYLAVANHFNMVTIILGMVVLFWVAGFDIIYALQDEAFDKSLHLNSIPVQLGALNALRVSNGLHTLSALLLLLAGYVGEFNFWFYIGAVVFIGLLIYQHTLVKYNDLSKVNLAFFTTNGIASVVFGCIVILGMYLTN
jgi:4-hydroxybenzoate polyprenyltransferase